MIENRNDTTPLQTQIQTAQLRPYPSEMQAIEISEEDIERQHQRSEDNAQVQAQASLIQANQSSERRELDNVFIDHDSSNREKLENQLSQRNMQIYQNLNEYSNKTNYEFLPEELFVNCLSYLNVSDLIQLACVSRSVRLSAYSPVLQTSLNLMRYNFGVSDTFIEHILTTSTRFSELKFFSLLLCNAITDRTLKLIARHCSTHLETLILCGCNQLTSKRVLQLIDELPKLKKIELYGCSFPNRKFVEQLVKKRPDLDLGCIWFLYCSANGIELSSLKSMQPEQIEVRERIGNEMKTLINEDDSVDVRNIDFDQWEFPQDFQQEKLLPETSSLDAATTTTHSRELVYESVETKTVHIMDKPVKAECRYREIYEGGGCQGRISGKIIYGNQHFLAPGNYPFEVSYSCKNHKDLDIKQDEYKKCQECNYLFLAESMVEDDIFCRVCYDRALLDDKSNQFRLKKTNIDQISFSDIAQKTLRLADKKNLPNNMKLVGSFTCDLDLSSIYEEYPEFQEGDDIPLDIFWRINKLSVQNDLEQLREILKSAKETKNASRALIVYESEGYKMSVYADQGIILADGIVQSGTHKLMISWKKFPWIFLPLILTLLLTIIIYSMVPYQLIFGSNNDSSRTTLTYIVKLLDPPLPILSFVIGFSVTFVFIIGALVLLWIFRRNIEVIFVKIISIIFFLVMSMSSFAIVVFIFIFYEFRFEFISLIVACWNFGMFGIAIFFLLEPKNLHRIYAAILLPVPVAIFCGLILRQYTLIFMLFLIGFEIWTMVADRNIQPFIYRNINNFLPPDISYTFGRIGIRPFSFFFYSLLISWVRQNFEVVSITIVIIISLFVVLVFLVPLKSLRIREYAVIALSVIFFGMILADLVQSKHITQGKYRWSFTGLQ